MINTRIPPFAIAIVICATVLTATQLFASNDTAADVAQTLTKQ